MSKTGTWDVQQIANELQEAHPLDIIRWGVRNIGASSLTLACSFGFEDVALIDFISQVDEPIDIFYLDTNLLFDETYEVRDKLQKKYQLDFIRVTPDLSLDEQAQQYGKKLWKRQPNQCCKLRKVMPLKKILTSYQGWITGIRREQSKTRANTEVVEWDDRFGLWKLNPLAYWKEQQVWDYIHERQIPYNRLHDENFPSIGCYPCTREVKPGEDPRAGRWAGLAKTECGLHNTRHRKMT